MSMQIIESLTISSPNAPSITFDGSNYILEEVTGLESPKTRLPRYNLPGNSGAFISNALYGERSIVIKGYVNAPDGSINTYLTNRTNLINVLTYARDNQNVLQPQTLSIVLTNGFSLTASVYVDTPLAMGFSSDQVDYEEFQVTLVAADPNLYSSTEETFTINLPVGGGTAIPTAIPISLAPSSGGQVVVTNPGSNISYPVITLTAPLTNPYITNLKTNQFIKINYILNPGDQDLVIDCSAQSITQGVNNKNGVQSQDSTFWGILAGSNTLGFSAAAGSGNCVGIFYPVFVGV
jgi:Phage tail protein